MSETVRHPAVAGRFYPSKTEVLEAEVKTYLSQTRQPRPALGCVVPHAGYMYSGHVAGAVYAALKVDIPKQCIVLGPNHTGMGLPLAIMSEGVWETPIGNLSLDSDLAASLKKAFPLLQEDADAHRAEHAIEVQLPFLHTLRPDISFVPITLGTARFDILSTLGLALAEVIGQQKEPVLMLASSDMNHYENDVITRVKDQKAIDCILALDARGLFDVVTREDISMCGFGPTVAMITAAKQLGAHSAELIKYATSGDVSGDRNLVVGYAGIVVQ